MIWFSIYVKYLLQWKEKIRQKENKILNSQNEHFNSFGQIIFSEVKLIVVNFDTILARSVAGIGFLHVLITDSLLWETVYWFANAYSNLELKHSKETKKIR